MKRLIVITALILVLVTGNSLAQNFGNDGPKLIAKAESTYLSKTVIIKQADILNDRLTSKAQKVNETYGSNTTSYSPQDTKAPEPRLNSKDISLLIKEELNLKKNLDLEYKSPKINFKEIPLFISSKDDKTNGVVLPPFLYFKQQF
jgi:hypothetical protein